MFINTNKNSEPISKKFMFRRIVGMPGDWIRESGSNIIISVKRASK